MSQRSVPGERYGVRSRPNVPVIIAILLIHILLIGALVQIRSHVTKAQDASLTVVNLSPPPPPPAEEAPPPPPSRPEVVAPPPIVQTPVPPAPQIRTTPDVSPPQSPTPVAIAVPAPSPVVAAPVAAPSLVQGGDLGAQMIAGKPPRYPVESRRKREQGTVVLTLTLGLDGAVENLVVTQSSGFFRLDKAASEAVRGWRWKPVLRSGQPVRVRGVVEIPFILRTDAA
ncbi:energy transducer TonB [Sphingobium soli]|uniref:Energy transducer TonB n=2 Tax=Sphingobium soli TaxID=1591116 RepID=A0ABS8GYC1_9SPHN|nr:energy transducer TonB [Sphingobium soli]MCC4231081.1 energy transducer TonB [Sphingobium soli]